MGKQFLILIDCRNLVPVLTNQEATTKRAIQWLQNLIGYCYSVGHILGSQSVIVDALFRNPIPYEEIDEHSIEVIMTVTQNEQEAHTQILEIQGCCDIPMTVYNANVMMGSIDVTVIPPLIAAFSSL